MKSLKSQFLFDLGKVYDAELRIAKALPQLNKPDTSEALKRALSFRAWEAAGHVSLVEQLFECLGRSAGEEVGGNSMGGNTAEFRTTLFRDAALVSALKMVEHGELPTQGCQREWEIASYGCLHDWANLLGNAEGADLLERLLEEEDSDKRKAN